MIQKPRILFFDILRIICVTLIVYTHYKFFWFNNVEGIDLNSLLFQNGSLYIYPKSIALVAVSGMIFVSGAVLEYNYKSINNFLEYKLFILKRFFRLYPIYWISLILGALLLLRLDAGQVYSGFTIILSMIKNPLVILGIGDNGINLMGWFIGTIFMLYLLFPLLSKIIRKNPHVSIIAFAIITFSFRYFMFPVISFEWLRVIPLYNLFEFGLGIYCVQLKLYPKNTHEFPHISKLADFTFYVFLFHLIIFQLFTPNDILFLISTPVINNSLTTHVFWIGENLMSNQVLNYAFALADVIVVSAIAMALDKKIQKIIRKKLFPANSEKSDYKNR